MSSTNGVGLPQRSPVSEPVPVACSSSQYLTTNLALASWSCASCPDGGYCNANDASEILPLYGYWFAGFDGTGLPIFVQCIVESACPGVDPLSGSWKGSISVLNVTLTAGGLPTLQQVASAKSTCAVGYSGVLCQDCSQGYAKQRDGQCSTCREESVVLFILGAGLVGIVFICGSIVYFTLRSRGEPGRPEVALLKVCLPKICIR